MKKTIIPLLGTLAISLCSSLATTVINGSISEFSSPDDLFFDPSTAVIAVNMFGDGDSTVNGVQFFTDRAGLGSAVTGEGIVTSGGVTVTTGLVNQIQDWAAPPNFTGGTPDSATNLSVIMESIRWANAANGQTVNVDIIGLNANKNYNVQLLFNEGRATNDRRYDIAVNGVLAVDDMSSEGDGGTYTLDNSFAYSGNFNSGAGASLNIILGQEPFPGDPNNTAPAGTDNNAILQAVIIHEVAIPEPGSTALLGLGLLSLFLRRRRL